MPISVTVPGSLAIATTKRILFQPFRFGKWIGLGFCSFLAQFVTGGNSGMANFNSLMQRRGFPNAGRAFRDATHWFQANWGLVLTLVAVVFVIALVLGVVLTWLGSRGQFMFIDGIVKDHGAVAQPWREYAVEGNSLFKFLVLFGFGIMLLNLVTAGLCLLLAWPSIREQTMLPGAIVAILIFASIFLLTLVVSTVVRFVLFEFIIPAMYLRRMRVGEAWAVVKAAIRPHIGNIVLFFLFQIVLSLGVGMVGMFLACVTCCVVAIPYVGAVILLPTTVFMRAYNLHYLEQFGPEWRFFAGREEVIALEEEMAP